MSKIKLVIVMVLLLAGTSFGLTTWAWDETPGTGLWSTNANWDTGTAPTINDSVHIGVWGYAIKGPVIDSTVAAKGYWIGVGVSCAWWVGPVTLTMTGGSLDATYLTLGYGELRDTVMNMSGGTVHLNNSLQLGSSDYLGVPTSGTLNMSDGVMTIDAYFNIGNGAGGAGTVNLSGGTINSPDIWMRDSTDAHPKLDITSSGKVVLPIGMKSRVELYNGNGWITGYGSPEDVVITEIEGGTKIEVTAIPEPMTIGLLAIGSLLALRKRS